MRFSHGRKISALGLLSAFGNIAEIDAMCSMLFREPENDTQATL